MKVVIEECYRAGVPFVEFDPSGVAWGARSSFDGSKPSGMQILVIGGRHGDVKLERGAGADVAREVIRANISCIIDFQGEPKSVYRQFAKDFCETALEINDSPRVFILEEAHELVPQLVRPDQTATFDAVSRLVGQGRNMGIGVVLVSQRTMKIHKDVLSQCDWVLVFGLSGPHDKKAMKEWVHDKDIEDEVWEQFETGLSKLAKQHAWFWSPEAFGGAFKVVKIRNFTTFHPDRTHLRKLGLLDRKPVTTDIAGIKVKLGTVMAKLAEEKTAAVDAKRLQHQVKQLEAQLAKEKARPPPAPAGPKVEVKRIEIPVVTDAQIRRVEQVVEKASAAAVALTTVSEVLLRETAQLQREIRLTKARPAAAELQAPPPRQFVPTLVRHKQPPRLETPAIREARASARLDGSTHSVGDGCDPPHEDLPAVKAGARRMLQELAQRTELNRRQVATLSRISPKSSTYRDYLSVLRRRGFIAERGDILQLTPAGRDFLGDDIPEAPQTTQEILQAWRPKLKLGAARMLDAIVEAHPNALSKEALGTASGISVSSSTFRDYLSVLRRNGLAATEGDQVGAGEALQLAAGEA